MDIILHWELTKQNFVNKEHGLSAKHRVGHKPALLTLSTTISVDRNRLDLKFKKMLEKALYRIAPAMHRDMRVKIFTDKLYILSSRDLKRLSNEITNVMVFHKGYLDGTKLDKQITRSKQAAK